MRVGKIPIQLKAFTLGKSGDDETILVRQDGQSYLVHESFLPLLQLCQSSNGQASLSDLANRLRADSVGRKANWGRFARLGRFLVFLNECGLLRDQKLIQMAEALRPDYKWRDSLAFERIFTFELLRIPVRSSWPYAVQILVLILLTSWQPLLIHFTSSSFELSESMVAESAWPQILGFFVIFTAGRSLRSICQFLSVWLMTEGAAVLNFRLDLLSVSLGTTDASNTAVNGLYELATFINLSALLAPLTMQSLFIRAGVPMNCFQNVGFWVGLLCFVELSPFRRTSMSEFLRSVYVYFERAMKQENAEYGIKTLHVFICVVWVICFGFFIVGPAKDFASGIWNSGFESTGRGLASLIALLLLLTIILFSFMDDLLSGIGDGGGADRFSIRRVWKRKGRSITSEKPDRNFLEQLPLLRQMNPEVLDSLLANSSVIEFGAGEFVCQQGEADRTLFILLSGQVSVCRQTKSGKRKVIALLESGSVFGEVAFFLGERRTADVLSIGKSRVLAIRHLHELSRLDQQKSEEVKLRIRYLQALVGSTVFSKLPSESLDALLFAGVRKDFRAGEKVFSEGEAGDSCYFIIQGQASVLQNFVVINRLKTGDAFGEIALLQPGLLRTASVVADSELQTVGVDGQTFWELLSSQLPLAIEMERLAENRLRKDAERT
jgi:CRP-like cAMP-binding protein